MPRLVIQKLQKRFSVLLAPTNRMSEEATTATMVPDDVSEGHFVVMAVKGEETKRFVVELDYLTNPAFLRLLEEAEEEYGFTNKGPLQIPCPPDQLQKILDANSRVDKSAAAAGDCLTCIV